MNEYKNLKRKWGEDFAKFCRSNLSTVLEENGLLSEILESKFTPSHYLFEDLQSQCQEIEFKNYIMGLYFEKKQGQKAQKKKDIPTPEELMDKAGYTLYKCETNDDVLSFKKFYQPGKETLCTFGDPTRIRENFIFFAVKKNVDEIRREDFTDPKRQDEYGTSVISLQFQKGTKNILSIKNRYNHAVENCDATFSNDPENIIAGLTEAFEHHYNLTMQGNNKFFPENYVLAQDGKYYRYNHEHNNTYYCADNVIVKNGQVTEYDKSKFILVDDFLLDLKEKSMVHLTDFLGCDPETIVPTDITKIDVKDGAKKGDRKIKISTKSGNVIEMLVNNKGQMIEYFNKDVVFLPSMAFEQQKYLKKFSAPNLIEMKEYCLQNSRFLEKLDTENLRIMGGSCLWDCWFLENLDLPNLEQMEDNCLKLNRFLKNFNAPKLRAIGEYCLGRVEEFQELNLPSLEKIGQFSFTRCQSLKKINLPNLENIDDMCFSYLPKVEELSLPKLRSIGCNCFQDISNVKTVDLPSATCVGNNSLQNIPLCEEINAPNLYIVNPGCFVRTDSLKTSNIPPQREEHYINHSYWNPRQEDLQK